jgi:hypothetical protein
MFMPYQKDQTDRFASRPVRADLKIVTAVALLPVFMISLIMPVSIDIFGARVSPSRLFILLTIVPLALQLVRGTVGKITTVDILVILFTLWMLITLIYHYGFSRLPYSLMSVAEVIGGYLVGRVLIRSIADFTFLIKCQLAVMMFLMPFAVLDFVTNNQLWAKILDSFGSATFRAPSSHPRWGFQRVLTGFDHPILFGLFCSIAAANVFYIWRDHVFRAASRLGFVFFMVFMSLSSGALLSALIQIFLIAWGVITKAKWWLLACIFIAAFVFLHFASNRGPLVILIETMTFNAGTGWTRILQWEYAGAEVLRNPIWGKGIDSNWIRPFWLYTSSIDSYWLVVAFRHGLPAIAFLGMAFLAAIIYIVRNNTLGQRAAEIRTGYLIAFVGICFTLTTVHIWNAVLIYIFCYLGAGMWLASNVEKTRISEENDASVQNRQPRYRREFGPTSQPSSSRIFPETEEARAPKGMPYSRFVARPIARAKS